MSYQSNIKVSFVKLKYVQKNVSRQPRSMAWYVVLAWYMCKLYDHFLCKFSSAVSYLSLPSFICSLLYNTHLMPDIVGCHYHKLRPTMGKLLSWTLPTQSNTLPTKLSYNLRQDTIRKILPQPTTMLEGCRLCTRGE